MIQKQSVQICKNLQSDNISDDDKFEAIDTVLSSPSNLMLVTKPDLISISKFLLVSYNEMAHQVLPIECVPFKPIRDIQQIAIMRCPQCNAVVKKSRKYCGNCGQRINWEDK